MSWEGVEHLLMHALRLMKDKMLFALSVSQQIAERTAAAGTGTPPGEAETNRRNLSSCAWQAALPM